MVIVRAMVTLITEQLRKQTLEEPYRKAFSFNVNASLPAVGSSPSVSWSPYGSTPESSVASYSTSKAHLIGSFGLDPLGPPVLGGEPFYQNPVPSASVTDLAVQSSPPPPPPKRHCRSLSVPEDLSRCRSTWRPSASKVWVPVKRRCQSGGVASLGSKTSSGPSSSLTSSSLHSSSSPTFFSLAFSPESPLPWRCPWEPCDPVASACSTFLPASSSSCSSSPAPRASCHSLAHRRFSLSPVHIQEASVLLQAPRPSPLPALIPGRSAAEPPGPCPSSPTSACSTPSSCRRVLLPRCHSQPCDMRRPRLKRRRDPDAVPCARPGLDFSKMTQIGTCDPPALCMEATLGTWCTSFSPANIPGQSSIGPLSESEEEEDCGNKIKGTTIHKTVFERDCTELDLNLIEDN